eukprot:219780_1
MELAMILFIAYFGAMILLLLLLSIRAYRTSQWKDVSSLVDAVASMKSIYGVALVHLYDTSTDIVILVSWGILTYHEVSGKQNYENVNMLSFLIPSILSIFVYRVEYAVFYWTVCKEAPFKSKRDIVLILFDLYVFVLVYQQFRLQYISPCIMQRKLQLLESVLESMPQLVIQSIFMIRTYNTALAQRGGMYIVFASIVASVLSIVTKFLHDDHQWVIDRAASLGLTYKKFPCFSVSYLLILLWRFCESIARFSIFTLLWAVVGGIYLPIYLLLSVIMYGLLEIYTDLVWIRLTPKSTQMSKKVTFIWVLQSIVGIPLRQRMAMMIIRLMDNSIMLTIISIFAFKRFDCVLCYDKSERNALYNPYVLVLLSIAIAATILEFIIYLGLYFMGVIKTTKTKPSNCVDIIGADILPQTARLQAAVHPAFYQMQLDTRLKSIAEDQHLHRTDNHQLLEGDDTSSACQSTKEQSLDADCVDVKLTHTVKDDCVV